MTAERSVQEDEDDDDDNDVVRSNDDDDEDYVWDNDGDDPRQPNARENKNSWRLRKEL